MSLQAEVHPVSIARFNAEGEASGGTGLSFDDYKHMQTQTHKQSGQRRYTTPIWALNDRMLQIVLVEYLLQRAFSHGYLLRAAAFQSTVNMKPFDKLRYAEEILRARVPGLEKRVVHLCGEYVGLKNSGGDPARIQRIESLIEGIDTNIIIDRSAGKVMAAIVYFYYRESLDSVGVALRIGLRPPCVRQSLYRMSIVAQGLGMEPERVRKTEEERIAVEKSAARLLRPVRTVAQRRADLRAARIAAGLCTRCGKNQKPADFKLCQGCRDCAKQKTQRRRASQNSVTVAPAIAGGMALISYDEAFAMYSPLTHQKVERQSDS
jgi:hypothetical protein